MSRDVFLCGAVRTPIGGFSGAFADTGASSLGSAAASASLERTGIPAAEVSEVIFGNVLGAGLGQNIARQIALGAGMPSSIGATTVNKVCGSGLKSVMLAAQAIKLGEAEIVVAGGAENMSQSPYLLPKARSGYRMGHGELVDAMIHDGLWDGYNDKHMGQHGDQTAEKYGFSREAQDDFAVASYKRALDAQQSGAFGSEIVPVDVVTRKSTLRVESDEEPARFNEEKLRSLRPAFGRDGTVTAGNASSVNDAAASVVVCSRETAEARGITPQARIVGYNAYAREPEWFTLAPVGAVETLMTSIGWAVSEVDLFEVNEAFSVVPMAVMKDLDVPHEKMNVHGGAVAIGHPIGASGTRVLVTLLNAMALRKARRGIVSLCIGGGEAVAMAVEAVG